MESRRSAVDNAGQKSINAARQGEARKGVTGQDNATGIRVETLFAVDVMSDTSPSLTIGDETDMGHAVPFLPEPGLSRDRTADKGATSVLPGVSLDKAKVAGNGVAPVPPGTNLGSDKTHGSMTALVPPGLVLAAPRLRTG